MRPDNPKCETCVAWEPPAHASTSPAYPYHDGNCRFEPNPVPRRSGDWCMMHETPEEWAMRTNIEAEALRVSARIYARRTE